jgi:hypothetical protein
VTGHPHGDGGFGYGRTLHKSLEARIAAPATPSISAHASPQHFSASGEEPDPSTASLKGVAMDQDTPRSHTRRSSPEPPLFEPGSRIPSDQPPPRPADGYRWTIPANSNSIPRLMTESSSLTRASSSLIPGSSALTPAPSVLEAFEAVGGSLPAAYRLCYSTPPGRSNLVTDAARALSGNTDPCGYNSRGEQSSLEKNEYPARPGGPSSPESNPTSCGMPFNRDSGPSLHASNTIDDTVPRSIANQEAGAWPLFPDRHEGYPVPSALESTSGRPNDCRYITNVHNLEPASVPGPLPPVPRYPRRTLSPIDRSDQDLLIFPRNDNGHSNDVPDLCAATGPQRGGLIMSSGCEGDTWRDENVEHVRQGATAAPTQMDTLSNDISSALSLSSGISNTAYSASVSPMIRPGLNLDGQQQHNMRTLSISSTAPTRLSDVSFLDDASPKDVPGPMSAMLDSLRKWLTTCLLARLLWNSLSFDVHNLGKAVRKCPHTSRSEQPPRDTGKRPLTEPSPQSDSSSWPEESGDESDHQGHRRRKKKNQRLDDSPSRSLPLLACPFHKMDPIRYSGLNAVEKEYRICSSGYWPDISRLM